MKKKLNKILSQKNILKYSPYKFYNLFKSNPKLFINEFGKYIDSNNVKLINDSTFKYYIPEQILKIWTNYIDIDRLFISQKLSNKFLHYYFEEYVYKDNYNNQNIINLITNQTLTNDLILYLCKIYYNNTDILILIIKHQIISNELMNDSVFIEIISKHPKIMQKIFLYNTFDAYIPLKFNITNYVMFKLYNIGKNNNTLSFMSNESPNTIIIDMKKDSHKLNLQFYIKHCIFQLNMIQGCIDLCKVLITHNKYKKLLKRLGVYESKN